MKTTGNKHEESATETSSHTGKEIVPSDIVESKIEMKDTTASPPKKGQTVPSSSLEGKVWLSYIPRERKNRSSESLTQE